MSDLNFSLHPFGLTGPGLDLGITGQLSRRAPNLAIRYVLVGRLAEVAMPAPAAAPARRRGLWEETCFEFFLGLQDSPGYWEFNLSPAGTWNVYRFSGYRQDLTEEPAFTSLPFDLQRRQDSLGVTLEIDLTRIIPAGRALEVGVAAVVKLTDGRATYWALSHPGPRPDFHRREGFSLNM